MRDFFNPSAPLDQADGLRRLFAASQVHFVPVVSNPQVAFSGVLLERLCSAFAEQGLHTLLVDAAENAPPAHELAALDLSVCIEALSPQVSFLAARGLPQRFVDARGCSESLLSACLQAAPRADVVVVHASASDLARMFSQRTIRPVLLAADVPDSVTHAYGAFKLLSQRNGVITFDVLLACDPSSPRAERIADRLSSCADGFLGAVMHDWAAVDPACALDDPPTLALQRVCRQQIEMTRQGLDSSNGWPVRTDRTLAAHPARWGAAAPAQMASH